MGAKGESVNVGGPQLGATAREGSSIMALTDVAIRNAKPRAKPYKLGDARRRRDEARELLANGKGPSLEKQRGRCGRAPMQRTPSRS